MVFWRTSARSIKKDLQRLLSEKRCNSTLVDSVVSKAPLPFPFEPEVARNGRERNRRTISEGCETKRDDTIRSVDHGPTEEKESFRGEVEFDSILKLFIGFD
jgi:hypothetical protein